MCSWSVQQAQSHFRFRLQQLRDMEEQLVDSNNRVFHRGSETRLLSQNKDIEDGIR